MFHSSQSEAAILSIHFSSHCLAAIPLAMGGSESAPVGSESSYGNQQGESLKEFLAKVNDTVPTAFLTHYEATWREEVESTGARATARAGTSALDSDGPSVASAHSMATSGHSPLVWSESVLHFVITKACQPVVLICVNNFLTYLFLWGVGR